MTSWSRTRRRSGSARRGRNGMVGRVERAIMLLALAAAGGGWAAPLPANAQNPEQPLQDSCTSFAQSLASQVYSASPWLLSAAAQQATPALRQILEGTSLQ